MKVFTVLIVVALWGALIYFGVREARHRRADRYRSFLDMVTENVIKNEDSTNEEEKV